MKSQRVSLFCIGWALAALAGCGGGDSAGSATPPPAPLAQPAAVGPVSTASTLVTSSSPSTYPPGTEEAAAFEKLNAARQACGFGLLAQNLKLDAAAMGHASWNVRNGYVGHYQTAGTAGFTGVTSEERIEAAGYALHAQFIAADENVTRVSPSKGGLGASGMATLLNAPYHLSGLMGSFRDIGLAVLSPAEVPQAVSSGATLQVNLAFKQAAGAQLMEAAAVATYPCEGSTGIDRQLTDETPSPVPGRDLSRHPLGTSIYIAARDGNALAITSASLINLASGEAVQVRPVLNSQSDPNKVSGQSYFRAHQAFITADAPLAAHTRYQAVVAGTNNAAAFSRTFIFTTGTGG
ncbi:MAG: Allergen V5/Tpx family protein [Polaromonas sp.]|nr:Allergen V5/Tpx family protein [Polaromonas sp.]